MGERSVPITCVFEYSSAKSNAQIPVPVPISKALYFGGQLHSL
jgi:hypothetical protein